MTPTSNPANPPDAITANTLCGCDGGCGTHTGPCKARHLGRHPQTRALIHLETTPGGGQTCPYCRLASTRPGTVSAAAYAALNRPSADADQPDLFDVTDLKRPVRQAAPR